MTSGPDLTALVNRALSWHRSRDAVVDGDRRLTFGELDDRSARLANALTHISAGRQVRVALVMTNRLEFVEADIALLRAGLTKVPINPRLSDDEKRYIIEDSGAMIAIVDGAHEDLFRGLVDEAGQLISVVSLDSIGDSSYESRIAQGSSRLDIKRIPAASPSIILYTSGTTGRPKGATLTFANRGAGIVNMLASELDVRPGDAMLHAGHLSHGSGSKVPAFVINGATNVVMEKFDPERFFDVARKEQITSTFLVPTMIGMLLDSASDPLITSMKTVSYGGARIDAGLLERAIAEFGNVFVQVYGSCEAPHPVTVLTQADHRFGVETEPSVLRSAGRPSLGASIRIVKPNGQVAAPGEEGEIHIAAASVMTGYWRNEEASAEVFSDGYYTSGDIAVQDELGFVHIVDRKRDMIISGGLNIYPAELERVLITHPDIKEVAVVGKSDPHWGEIVEAHVVKREGSRLSEEDVIELTREALAGYKKPRSVVFREELPKGATGKILKTALRAAPGK